MWDDKWNENLTALELYFHDIWVCHTRGHLLFFSPLLSFCVPYMSVWTALIQSYGEPERVLESVRWWVRWQEEPELSLRFPPNHSNVCWHVSCASSPSPTPLLLPLSSQIYSSRSDKAEDHLSFLSEGFFFLLFKKKIISPSLFFSFSGETSWAPHLGDERRAIVPKLWPATECLERSDKAVKAHFASNRHGELHLPFAISGGCSQTPISDLVKGPADIAAETLFKGALSVLF